MKKDEILREKIKTALISTFKVISLKFNKDKLEDFNNKATDLISQKNEITLNKKELQSYKYTSEQNRLHFSVKDPDEELPKIIQILSKSGLHIQKIESRKSSLEDVFLDLTGKGING